MNTEYKTISKKFGRIPPPHFFCRCFEFSCCLVCTDMKISDFILIAMKFLSKKKTFKERNAIVSRLSHNYQEIHAFELFSEAQCPPCFLLNGGKLYNVKKSD